MELKAKQTIVGVLSLFFLGSLLIVGYVESEKLRPERKRKVVVTAANTNCVQCHTEKTRGIVEQWKDSQHAQRGVGCMDCHGAQKGEPDAWDHEGSLIATIVSPKDCSKCHQKEFQEFTESHHAKAAQFIGSLDNMLGEIIEGTPAAITGCQQCHGSTIKVLANGNIDPTTWPNTGMGRINPDGSLGACSACHLRHQFAPAQARQPEACGRCHMGPDHPQIEIYEESKHGVAFRARINEMNLAAQPWVVGIDYTAAPTCATCHMSATPKLPVTHDVGKRISWTLRPVISTKLENWETRRADMKKVCENCHGPELAENFYKQFDAAVELYNEKFAKPAKAIMDQLYAAGKLTQTPFDDHLEWTFYELWHHEGRRARMGASMQGQDFTQWHGFYEVAKHFYTKFLPEAEELKPEITKEIVARDEHKWLRGMTKEEIQKQIDFYRQRYGQ